MDPYLNPFSPGAGTPPPELAGRDDVLENAKIALHRKLRGRAAQSQVLLGLRGTGKTVLLVEIEKIAKEIGFHSAFVEAPEGKALVDLLYPMMRKVLQRLSVIEVAKAAANKALAGLRNFASVFKVKVNEIEIAVDPAVGTADSGILEQDLTEMFELIGNAAKLASQGWLLLIDEVQYLKEDELSAIIVAVHRTSQLGLPVLVVAAGLPQIAKLAGDAKSYSERLFLYPPVGALGYEAASRAIRNPLKEENVSISKPALDFIIEETSGYPFFLQEWGYQAWNKAVDNSIDLADAEAASELALKRLDDGFFNVRIERLTPAEVDYVNAMAQLGKGPYKSTDVANELQRESSSLGPRRASIIHKGMIYSPSYGEIDFTVPLFDDYLRRRLAGAND